MISISQMIWSSLVVKRSSNSNGWTPLVSSERWMEHDTTRHHNRTSLSVCLSRMVRGNLSDYTFCQIDYHYFIDGILANNPRSAAHITYRSFDSAARSRWRRFLNQFDTCVTVNAVISASSFFSRGDGYGFLPYHSRRTFRDRSYNIDNYCQNALIHILESNNSSLRHPKLFAVTDISYEYGICLQHQVLVHEFFLPKHEWSFSTICTLTST